MGGVLVFTQAGRRGSPIQEQGKGGGGLGGRRGGEGRGGGSSKAINMCMLTLTPRACAECAQDESRQNDCCCRGRAGRAVHGDA